MKPISARLNFKSIKLAAWLILTKFFMSAMVPAHAQFNVTVQNVRNNSFLITWTVSPGAAKYEVKVRRASQDYWVNIPGYPQEFLSATLSHQVTDAKYNLAGSYDNRRNIRIVAYDSNGKYINNTNDVIIELRPTVPKNVTVSKITSSGFTVNWDMKSIITGGTIEEDHRITVSKKNGAAWEALPGYPKVINKPATTTTVTGLAGGTGYRVSMQCYTKSGTFQSKYMWSDYTEDMVLTRPDAPTAYVASGITPTSFTAGWTKVTGATSYKLSVYDVDKLDWHARDIYVVAQSYQVSGLKPNNRYSYYVVAVNSSGTSNLSDVVQLKTENLPIPVAKNPTNVNETGFRANWNTAVGATRYLLYLYGPNGNLSKTYDTTDNKQDITGLNPNSKYSYKVRAWFGNLQQVEFSNVIELYTKSLAPVALPPDEVMKNRFRANWEHSPGAVSYRLFVWCTNNSANNPSGYFPKNLGLTSSWTIQNLKEGQTYRYFVQAVTEKSESLKSNDITVDMAPDFPVLKTEMDIGSTFIKYSWEPGEGATHYELHVWDVGKNEGVTNFHKKSTNKTSAEVTGLTPNSKYNIGVNAYRNDSRPAWSGARTVTTLALPAEQYTVSLSASPTAGGTVSGAGTFNQNASVTVVATPATNYEFVNWTEGTSVVSTSASYKFTITKNRSLVANFRQKTTQYTLTLSATPTAGGTVSGAGTFNQNASVTVVATPATNFEFVNWTEGASVVSTSASYKFTITKNRSLVANFRQKTTQYTLTLSASPTAGGTVSGAGTFNQNASVTVMATPATNFEFISWNEGTNVVSTNVTHTFALNKNVTLTARFEIKTSIEKVNESEILVFPNPVVSIINITGLKIPATIRILDMAGRTLHFSQSLSNEEYISMKRFNPGVYLVTIESEDARSVFKVVKH